MIVIITIIIIILGIIDIIWVFIDDYTQKSRAEISLEWNDSRFEYKQWIEGRMQIYIVLAPSSV